jgi:hypothetical protein
VQPPPGTTTKSTSPAGPQSQQPPG